MNSIYSESGRNIHRIVAIILAATTWITVYSLAPNVYIPICILTAALEFSAYKTLSNRTKGVNKAYYHAGVAITIASSLFSLAAGFVLESSVKNRSIAVAVDQSARYSESAVKVMASNTAILEKFTSGKEARIEKVNIRYDQYQNEIGTTWWKREFEKNPRTYRNYPKGSGPREWVEKRDSLEKARAKAIAEIEGESIPESMLATVPKDFSTSTIEAGAILSIASRWAIIIIDTFCLIVMINIMFNEEEDEREGITDSLLIAPILLGRRVKRLIEPVVVEEDKKDVELEGELVEKEKEIKALKRQIEYEREVQDRLDEINNRKKEELKEEVEGKEFVKIADGKIVVGEREFAHKKSLQTAISRERQRGNEEEAKRLQTALEEYVRKNFPHLSSPGGN